MTLSDTQRLILADAVRHADGLAAPPASLPPAPRAAVAHAMLRAGLLTPAAGEAAAADRAWKLDGAWVCLRITDAGRQVVGAEAGLGVEEAAPGTAASDAAEPITSSPDTAADGVPGPEAAAACEGRSNPEAAPEPTGRAAPHLILRRAAEAVLAAWETAAPDQGGLAAAVEALRSALKPARARPDCSPRQPRSGTKQEQVLALLRRPEGATVAQIADATGWQAHTVRGFFAGLKKHHGLAVEAVERVRQVGPNKEGAKGSYSIYRLTEAG